MIKCSYHQTKDCPACISHSNLTNEEFCLCAGFDDVCYQSDGCGECINKTLCIELISLLIQKHYVKILLEGGDKNEA